MAFLKTIKRTTTIIDAGKDKQISFEFPISVAADGNFSAKLPEIFWTDNPQIVYAPQLSIVEAHIDKIIKAYNESNYLPFIDEEIIVLNHFHKRTRGDGVQFGFVVEVVERRTYLHPEKPMYCFRNSTNPLKNQIDEKIYKRVDSYNSGLITTNDTRKLDKWSDRSYRNVNSIPLTEENVVYINALGASINTFFNNLDTMINSAQLIPQIKNMMSNQISFDIKEKDEHK